MTPDAKPPTVTTRFRPPTPVRNEVIRASLVDRIDAIDPRFVVIHAPAGYGKSTLASQWLRILNSRKRCTVWLGLDADDNNPAWFLAHLGEALAQVINTSGVDIRSVYEEHPDDVERWVLPIFINLIEQQPRKVTVVLDDWHLVDSPRCHGIVEWLCEHAGERLQLVITTRALAGLPLARLRLTGQLCEVSADELRFDSSELEAFLADQNTLALGGKERNQLLTATDGWAAGLQLAVLGMQRNTDVESFLGNLSNPHSDITSYLTNSVFDELSSERLNTLLTLSVPDKITTELAHVLLDSVDLPTCGNLDDILYRIAQDNLFLQALDTEADWYRFHHMFLDQLRRRFARIDNELLQELRLTAAQWLSDNGHPSDAVSMCLAANNTEAAVAKVREHAMALVEHSRMSTLLALCAKLPPSTYQTDPTIQFSLAWANCLLHRARDAQTSLDRLANQELDRPARIEWRVIQACIDMYADHPLAGRDIEEECFAQAAELRPWVVSVLANIVAFRHLRAQQPSLALKVQQWARRFHDETVGPFSVVYGYLFESLALNAQGHSHDAVETARLALQVAKDRAGDLSHAARLAGAVMSFLSWPHGSTEQAESLAHACCELGTEGGVVDFMAAGYSTLARLQCADSRIEEAKATLDNGIDVARKLELVRLEALMHAERAYLRLPQEKSASLYTASETCLPVRFDVAVPAVLAQAVNVFNARPDHKENSTSSAQGHEKLNAQLQLMAEHAQRCGNVAETSLIQAIAGLLAENSDTHDHRPEPHVPVNLRGIDHLLPPIAGTHIDVIETTDEAESHTQSLQMSERETQILQLLASGKSNRQIADSAFLGVNTVKWHLKNLYRRLGVSNRDDCVKVARQRGMVA